MRRRLAVPCLLVSLLAVPLALSPHQTWAQAGDPPEIVLTFLGDRFEPAEIAVPADVKFVLRVINRSTATMEWESKALNREKLVPPGKDARIFIGPVKAGTYEYFDDFHPKIRGTVVAR